MRDLIFYGASVALSQGLPYLLAPLFAVWLGASVFGEYAFFINMMAVMAAFIGFVSHSSLAREFYRIQPIDRTQLLKKLIIQTMILSSVAGCILLAIESWFSLDLDLPLASIGATLLVLNRLVYVFLHLRESPFEYFKLTLLYSVCYLSLLTYQIYIYGFSPSTLVLSGVIASVVLGYVFYRTTFSTDEKFLNFNNFKFSYIENSKLVVFIYIDAIISVLFPFIDKIMLKTLFTPEVISSYYFCFSMSMIYALFSDIYMKKSIPVLLKSYALDSASIDSLFTVNRFRYFFVMLFFLLIAILSFYLLVGFIPSYSNIGGWFVYIFLGQFFITQIKYDNVWFVALSKGRALLTANISAMGVYLLILYFLKSPDVTMLAQSFSFGIFLWWANLLFFRTRKYMVLK